jgi:hypothetical protein
MYKYAAVVFESNGNKLLRRKIIFAIKIHKELSADNIIAKEAICPKHFVHRKLQNL